MALPSTGDEVSSGEVILRKELPINDLAVVLDLCRECGGVGTDPDKWFRNRCSVPPCTSSDEGEQSVYSSPAHSYRHGGSKERKPCVMEQLSFSCPRSGGIAQGQ
jgi:hypothetical protein